MRLFLPIPIDSLTYHSWIRCSPSENSRQPLSRKSRNIHDHFTCTLCFSSSNQLETILICCNPSATDKVDSASFIIKEALAVWAPRRTVENTCVASVRAPCIHVHLSPIATTAGERCGSRSKGDLYMQRVLYDHGFSAAAFLPEMRPKAINSPTLPPVTPYT